jgi:integrase
MRTAVCTAPVPRPPATPTVADMLTRYTREILPSKAPSTSYQLRLLYQWMTEELGTLRLTELTSTTLFAWRLSLERRGYAPGTIKRYCDALSGPLTLAALRWHWLDENPMRAVEKPPAPPPRVRYLSDLERDRLLLACQVSRNPWLYPMVQVALATGGRKNEVRGLRWSDVDLVEGVVRFLRTKTGQARAVPLTGPALEVIRQLSVDHPYHLEAYL